MKIEEFKKYKRLAESQDFEDITSPDVQDVYRWMEESGRLDEGFFSSIWQWMKRNFSITSRRLHSLADDYENELREELRAEWKKTKNPKDLASKFRAGTYNRLSRDIAERMEIIAEDDETYRTLARVLVNKKDLKVKKEILKELSGMIDPEEFNEALGDIQKDVNRRYSEAEKEYDKVNKTLLVNERKKIDDIVKFMRKKLNDDKSLFRSIGVSSDADQMEFIKLMYMYVNALSSKVSDVDFDSKNVYANAKEYLDFVREMSKKLENSGMSSEEAVKKVRQTLDKHLKEIKNVLPIGRLKTIVSKELSNVASQEIDTENDVTSDHTEDLINQDQVDTALDNAEQETGKENPTNLDIRKEIAAEIMGKMFSDDNIDTYVVSLNKRIDNFNSLDRVKRKTEMKEYEYQLDNKFMLEPATRKNVEKLIHVYIELVGEILPYYQRTEDSISIAATTAKRFMFEIYAMKKDVDGQGFSKLKDEEKTKLIKNIKEKYPDLFA